ncbi:unnamed protein product [Parascedosporium putredinis]|uniref:Uncharacterized protein n=1 Tax=Parascedosporium putredinis TaxID=1442378 RepID=A0A9P1M7S2_9PEZI|nr:unnamed protein product [Parascedosporium putredinis]CAI7988797.1 unnamed protein product [Parascedosporium putredinis]
MYYDWITSLPTAPGLVLVLSWPRRPPDPRLANRRVIRIVGGLAFSFVIIVLFTLAGSIPTGPSLSEYASNKFPPLPAPVHPPPRQKNDTYEEASWWADWKWLVPFSSSLTLDEDRSLLPPLSDLATKDAESELLLMWRMAWWAKGFRPVILTAAEATNNPHYETLQHVQVEDAFKPELMRWLAFENMGGGLLSDPALLPMGAYDDSLISFLRRRAGEYPALTTWAGLDGGLYAATKQQAADFLQEVMEADLSKPTHPDNLTDLVRPESIKSYPKVADAVKKDGAKGLLALRDLMNAHSHIMWQNLFSDGIAILKPLPRHTTLATEDAWQLGHMLANCPESPLPDSCPLTCPSACPARADSKVKVTTPERYVNSSTVFTVATVLHPYTLVTLDNVKETLTVDWVRRQMARDPWLYETTLELLGTKVGSGVRAMRIKEAIAGTENTGPPPQPRRQAVRRRFPEEADPEAEQGSSAEAELERSLLLKALGVVASPGKDESRLRDAVEAWNLGDTEAWKFARAFLARQTVERVTWEAEESQYGEGAGSEGGRHTFDRWVDKLEEKLDRIRH